MMVIQTPWQRHREHNDRCDGQNADEQNTLSSTIHHVAASNPLSTGGRAIFPLPTSRGNKWCRQRSLMAGETATAKVAKGFSPTSRSLPVGKAWNQSDCYCTTSTPDEILSLANALAQGPARNPSLRRL